MAKFKPGQSGNPAGRPRGTKVKSTELRELLQAKAPELVAKVAEMALDGDATALRMCLDRILPPLRPSDGPSPEFDLGDGNLGEQAQRVTSGLAEGQLTAEQANALMSLLAGQARILETAELERRIAALEAKNGNAT
ncbi:DUF5681 domain-containing protein [Aromatoleum toluclasticum]|uniref:DUF5681 domain-containing protein n=1 Tax=Aromatoleum toluclasticum TaxID=92003 RepID=UPI001D18B2DE|nr:DUF5681 domain-containing protein [Aromatoleum toluclasticum]MCC4115335.1 DUF5681 domain-containing protein [Aromatoleum toluclasticum]